MPVVPATKLIVLPQANVAAAEAALIANHDAQVIDAPFPAGLTGLSEDTSYETWCVNDASTFTTESSVDVGPYVVLDGTNDFSSLVSHAIADSDTGMLYFHGIVDADCPNNGVIFALGNVALLKRFNSSKLTCTFAPGGSGVSDLRTDFTPAVSFGFLLGWEPKSGDETRTQAITYINTNGGDWASGNSNTDINVTTIPLSNDYYVGEDDDDNGGAPRFKGQMRRLFVANVLPDLTLLASKLAFEADDGTATGYAAAHTLVGGSENVILDLWGDADRWNAGTNAGTAGDFTAASTYTDAA